MNRLSSPVNVLILSHNAKERLDYVTYLINNQKHCPFNVTESDSGENGLAICCTQLIDCLVIDYALLDPKGLNFIDKFYKDRLLDRKVIPIILLTNPEQDLNLTLSMLQYGVQDILFKQQSSKESLLHAILRAIQTTQEQHTVLAQKPNIKSTLFDQLLTQIKDALFIFELKSGHFIEANAGAIKSLQIDPTQTLSEYNLYNLPALQPGLADWEKHIALAQEQPHESILFTTQYQTRFGKILPLQVDLRFVPSTTNENPCFIAMAYDIQMKNILDQKFLSFEFFNPDLDVYTPQYFNLMLEQEFRRAMRMNYPLSLILLQPVLSNPAQELTPPEYHFFSSMLSKHVKRAGDLISQYGKSGFCTLLPNTNAHQAHAIAQLFLETLTDPSKRPIEVAELHFHFAIGIGTQTPTIHHEPSAFWILAETALKRALTGSTDQIEIISFL